MRTIGRTYCGPTRNYSPHCDYCGVRWLRTDMTLTADGLLACPDDRDGKTARELDEEIANQSPPPAVRGGQR